MRWYFQEKQQVFFAQMLENNTGFWQIVSHADVGDTTKNYVLWSFYK